MWFMYTDHLRISAYTSISPSVCDFHFCFTATNTLNQIIPCPDNSHTHKV